MYRNFLIEIAEEINGHRDNSNEIQALRKDILSGMWLADVEDIYDGYMIDTEIILIAIDLGWNYKDYIDDSTYPEEYEGGNDDDIDEYLNDRLEIVNAAYEYIIDTQNISIWKIEDL